jgi:hypothetical protein
LIKPFEGEAGTVPLLEESEAAKLEQAFYRREKACVFLK